MTDRLREFLTALAMLPAILFVGAVIGTVIVVVGEPIDVKEAVAMEEAQE